MRAIRSGCMGVVKHIFPLGSIATFLSDRTRFVEKGLNFTTCTEPKEDRTITFLGQLLGPDTHQIRPADIANQPRVPTSENRQMRGVGHQQLVGKPFEVLVWIGERELAACQQLAKRCGAVLTRASPAKNGRWQWQKRTGRKASSPARSPLAWS